MRPPPPPSIWVGFPKLWVPFFSGRGGAGAHNKDYQILGSILGSPYLGKLPDLFFTILLSRCEGMHEMRLGG